MATEGPMIHDGSQCIAAANYTNTAGAAGPSGSGQFLAVVLSTSADRTVVLTADSTHDVYGILQNKPNTGEAADVCIFGITKAVVASAGSTRGTAQMATSTGAVTDYTATGGKVIIGYALESGTSGQVITMFFGNGQIQGLA